MECYIDFSRWLNKFLENELPSNVIAINFNLYEGVDDSYFIQLVGADEFDEEDEDWACSEVFSSKEDIFSVPRTEDKKEWQFGLAFFKRLIEKYLDEGRFCDKLKKLKVVGVGFVDGDIDILYLSK